jgi:cytidine deaminase
VRFDEQLKAFPEAGRALLADVLEDDFRGVLRAAHATALAETVGDDLLLLLVPFAQRYALPPISGFEVGAVARGTTGSLYFGANMEYVGTALSFSVHAEQSATTNAWLHGEDGLEAIAVSSLPCGYCRQFLYELEGASRLPVLWKDKALLLGDLLPDAFGPADLGKSARLMKPERHGLKRLDPPSSDSLVLAALGAADASYSPYTESFAGVALETAGGAVFTGRYAESAAYNPSMSPLESALTMRVLGGGADDALTRAVLVEKASAPASQAGATAEVLRFVSSVKLEVYGAS